MTVECPVCHRQVGERQINAHLDRCLQGNDKSHVINPPEHIDPSPLDSSQAVQILPDHVIRLSSLMADDYFLRKVAWGPNDVLAVAPNDSAVELFSSPRRIDPDTEALPSHTVKFEDAKTQDVLKWAPDGQYLACGRQHLSMIDAESMQLVLQFSQSQSSSIQAIDFATERILAWGNFKGQWGVHDLRSPEPVMVQSGDTVNGICGISWNAERRLIATGGRGDRSIRIWDVRKPDVPCITIKGAHSASTKAIAFHPMTAHLLATGGGAGDGKVRLWHTEANEDDTVPGVAQIDAQGQVCELLWSPWGGELGVCTGYGVRGQGGQCVRTIDFPGCQVVSHMPRELPNVPNSRRLCATLGPDGEWVAIQVGARTVILSRLFHRRMSSLQSLSAQTVVRENVEWRSEEGLPTSIKQIIMRGGL